MFKKEENHFDTYLFDLYEEDSYEKPITLNLDLGYDENDDSEN